MRKIITLSVVASISFIASIKPAQALDKGWSSIPGVIIGMPVGAIAATLRGAFSKGSDHADDFSDALGGNSLSKLIGIPTGFTTGAVTGALTGLIKGLVDGAVLGVTDPLSPASASLEGDLLDYEPYKIIHSTKSL